MSGYPDNAQSPDPTSLTDSESSTDSHSSTHTVKMSTPSASPSAPTQAQYANVTKLTATTFHNWKLRIETLLGAYRLRNYILEDVSPPTDPTLLEAHQTADFQGFRNPLFYIMNVWHPPYNKQNPTNWAWSGTYSVSTSRRFSLDPQIQGDFR